jgi:hypothetical protein
MSAALAWLGVAVGGCAVAGIAAVAGKAIEDAGTRTVEAEYTGLTGKSFAVVVAADRIIQTDYPGAADYIAIEVSRMLHDNAGASAFIPPGDVLTYLARNPGWQGKPLEELGADLGVQRLVYIDLYEYRLHEPGNAYEWDGVAAGRIAVVEIDSPAAGAYAFDRVVQVRFPGRLGVDRDTMSRQMVNTGLAQRFVNRSAWLLFTHEEPNKIEY